MNKTTTTTTTVTCPEGHEITVTTLPLGVVLVAGLRLRMPSNTLDIICNICGQMTYYARPATTKLQHFHAELACDRYNRWAVAVQYDFTRTEEEQLCITNS